MRRRDLIGWMLGAMAAAKWPSVGLGQERPVRIGLLRTTAPPDPFVEAFREGMRALGYEDGRNIVYEASSMKRGGRMEIPLGCPCWPQNSPPSMSISS